MWARATTSTPRTRSGAWQGESQHAGPVQFCWLLVLALGQHNGGGGATAQRAGAGAGPSAAQGRRRCRCPRARLTHLLPRRAAPRCRSVHPYAPFTGQQLTWESFVFDDGTT